MKSKNIIIYDGQEFDLRDLPAVHNLCKRLLAEKANVPACLLVAFNRLRPNSQMPELIQTILAQQDDIFELQQALLHAKRINDFYLQYIPTNMA